MRINRKIVKVQHTRIQLNGKDILKLLKATNKVKITKETGVFFTIPTGGDWSGMTLNFLEDKDLVITVSSKSYDK